MSEEPGFGTVPVCRSAEFAERREAVGTVEPATEDGNGDKEETSLPLNPALRLFRSRHIRDRVEFTI